MEFAIGDSEKVYKLPLAASLPMSTLIELREVSGAGEVEAMRFQVDLLRKYMGDDVDMLTVGDVAAIYEAWNEESSKGGSDLGE